MPFPPLRARIPKASNQEGGEYVQMRPNAKGKQHFIKVNIEDRTKKFINSKNKTVKDKSN